MFTCFQDGRTGHFPLVSGSRTVGQHSWADVEVTESSVLQLPFTASSVGVARRHLVSGLIEAGVFPAAGTHAALVISELLSHALRHPGPLPGPGLRVAWGLSVRRLRVAVSDGAGAPTP